MNFPGAYPPKPIPLKERASLVFIERARVDVKDGAFVAIDANGNRTHVPVGGVACLMLEPGARISHAAVSLAGRVGTLVVWIGEAGVRMYSAGQPGGARSDKLLWQVSLALDPVARLRVVKEMYRLRFDESAPSKRSIEQLRGIEGARVRESYKLLAKHFGVKWKSRKYNPNEWDSGDLPNRCLSSATACLYGLTEAAVLAAGYAPAIGFLHSGRPLSFVYDIADIWKMKTVVPEAFRIAGLAEKKKLDKPVEQAVRLACRNSFRKSGLLSKIIPQIEDILMAGNLPLPEAPTEAQKPVFETENEEMDAGHRG
ncbi:MAG: type I-E CRISPR-associated endonuclease Cas1e [Rhodobacteraceae bacterium]|nr:type I-E CRISPR-associated endonuclease Cas1e [Paracoccaceae bacterium]MCY4250456.1 type I-E CRISPR-associated endonuclease Cas1e [Paracoccaceae bacterium]MCY4307438.1 type I-E CRISPR-associated endonuclease Cas1e [Paracoccaceae bacterium]